MMTIDEIREREELPFWVPTEADEIDDEDEDEEEYQVEVDMSYITDLEAETEALKKKVEALQRENDALRRMLHDTDAIRQSLRR